MRIWQLAFFIFVFQLMINLGSSIPLGFNNPAPFEAQYIFDTTTLENTELKINGTSGSASSGAQNDSVGIWASLMFIISGVGMMAGMLINSIIHTGTFINTIFGAGVLPEGFTWWITQLVRLIYIIGMVQLFLGRSFKNDD